MITGYCNINQVIYEACERLGISNSEAYELRFLRLILDAELKISTGLISGKKILVYEPGSYFFKDSKKLMLPEDLVDHLSILDLKKKEIDKYKYIIRGNYIIFSEIKTDPIILEYNGVIFDMNDQPVISLSHFEAVVSYLVYMETTTRYHSKKAAHYEFIDSRDWWQDRLAEARGNDAFPTSNDIKEASGAFHSVKMYLEMGILNVENATNLDDAITEYENLSKLFYGILSLDQSITTAEEYNASMLNPITETTSAVLSSNDFILTLSSPGRLVLSVPFNTGNINSMLDAANNNIFEGYFDIYVDELRKITIYVGKEFLNTGSYKLTFGFSN